MVNYKESHSFSYIFTIYLHKSNNFCNFAAFFVMRCFKTIIKTMQKNARKCKIFAEVVELFYNKTPYKHLKVCK